MGTVALSWVSKNQEMTRVLWRRRLTQPFGFVFVWPVLLRRAWCDYVYVVTVFSPRLQSVLGSIVVSISACHAEDPGSIPGRGGHFFFSVCVVFCHIILSTVNGFFFFCVLFFLPVSSFPWLVLGKARRLLTWRIRHDCSD